MRSGTSVVLLMLFAFGAGLFCSGAVDTPAAVAVSRAVRALDFSALPGSAAAHNRRKWSGDGLLYIDDEPTPLVYVFDRAGQATLNAAVQIPQAGRIRLDDYALAPDGSVWTAGHANSPSGQPGPFLAHIAPDGSDIHVVQTMPYFPYQIAVAPDGTIWTEGMVLRPDEKGAFQRDMNEDTLRHFDASGKQIGSAVPARTVGRLATVLGFLVANSDRLGWYSPAHGGGAYVEFSPDMSVLHSYPVAHDANDRHSIAERFVLTPGGRAFVVVSTTGLNGSRVSSLYELDRAASAWVHVNIPKTPEGGVPWLEGNDGELLVFDGPAGASQLQLFDVLRPGLTR